MSKGTIADGCIALYMLDGSKDALTQLPAPDRLALARALVADMPGVMCGRVPEAAVVTPGGNQLYRARVEGFNACRTAMLANGEKNDGQ